MNHKLENKVAVITGGNSGIGLATAAEYARQGAQVVILARSQEKLAAAIAHIGHNACGYLGDITDLASIKSLYENVAKNFGKIDIVFSSAGVFAPTMLEDTDETLFDQISNINFKGAYFTVKYAVPYLNKGASVVLVSSCLNEMGAEGGALYNATKAAVRSLARSLTPELVKIDARINVLSPGPVETPIHTNRGLSEAEATKEYGEDNITVYNSGFAAMYTAVTKHRQMTRMKLICAGEDQKVVGLHGIGAGMDEILQGFGVAMKMGATKADFDSCVAIHPTSGEEFVTLN